MDEIISKGQERFEGNFRIVAGKIVLLDTSKVELKDEKNSVAKEDTLSQKQTKEVDTPAEENNFYKIAKLNPLSIVMVDSAADVVDKTYKIAFAFIKISKNKISIIIRDSLTNNHDVLLVQLNEKIKLTTYSEDYFLNFKTPFGWEYLKIESWNKGDFLNMVPFYFTNYNDKTGDVNVFLKSTSDIYQDLKPVYNNDKIILGVKGVSNPKVVIEKFKNSSNYMMLMKVK
ncbi:MAG TPA: hypothetical protein VJI69_01860 [Bacteroidia bacterium]|nr:hypothetical protein [Bacteroidia bacterium]